MYNEYKDEIVRCRDIAFKRENKNNSAGSYHMGDGISDLIEEIQNDEVFKYLQTLSDEAVQVIGTVMYIGRDVKEEEVILHGKDVIFKNKYKDLFKEGNLNEHIRSQIKGKAKLGDYLEEGMKILDL